MWNFNNLFKTIPSNGKPLKIISKVSNIDMDVSGDGIVDVNDVATINGNGAELVGFNIPSGSSPISIIGEEVVNTISGVYTWSDTAIDLTTTKFTINLVKLQAHLLSGPVLALGLRLVTESGELTGSVYKVAAGGSLSNGLAISSGTYIPIHDNLLGEDYLLTSSITFEKSSTSNIWTVTGSTLCLDNAGAFSGDSFIIGYVTLSDAPVGFKLYTDDTTNKQIDGTGTASITQYIY
jgi:hypothetical protein